jgi:hypothetical protein
MHRVPGSGSWDTPKNQPGASQKKSSSMHRIPGSHWMHGGIFFLKKIKKYPEGFLKSFSVFFKEKLQKSKTYYHFLSR